MLGDIAIYAAVRATGEVIDAIRPRAADPNIAYIRRLEAELRRERALNARLRTRLLENADLLDEAYRRLGSA